MEKTYKCKNGHKFKKEEGPKVICPSCNEPAELVKWKTIDEFDSSSKGPGVIQEVGSAVGSVVGAIKGRLKW